MNILRTIRRLPRRRPTPPVVLAVGKALLEDGTSRLLLEDGTFLLLEG